MKVIEEESLAMELLKSCKCANKRLFITLIIVLVMWFSTIGYLVYVLNDTGTYTETISQDSEQGYHNYIGNDGAINNGKANDN